MNVSTAVVLWALTLWSAVESLPLSNIHGDLCKRMNNRKYYLEADTRALITAANVTLPAFPRIATQSIKSSGYRHGSRRHRREGAQEIGILQSRYRRNISSLSSPTLSSLASPPQKPFPVLPNARRLLPSFRAPLQPPPASPKTPEPPASPSVEDDMPLSDAPSDILQEDSEIETVEADVATSITQPFKCGVELFTCPDCHLEFSFERVNLPSCSHDQSCRCDYLRLREPPYMGGGGRDVCSTGGGTPRTFTTQTREVMLDFLYTRGYDDAFALTVIAKRNKYRITGKVNETVGHIRSPFFPELYPKDHWMEYELVANDPLARVKVTFLDFQLSPWSFVEIQDTNKTRLAVFNGNVFRPPVLVSSGPHLTLRFSGNGETARGFNMEYDFISAESQAVEAPITDCGGYVTNFGGTITMMNMAKNDSNFTTYDCVWIVQPPQNYAFKSHLSIRVVQFEDMASGTRLDVRQGLTSEDYLLEAMEGGSTSKTGQEHVVAIDTGFYVRLRGAFNKDSKLAIVYTSFSYLGSCYTLTDLMCHNHRCIPKMLRCDGFDHCGDNSDEPSSCYRGGDKNLTPEDAAWWYQHTPNYYFPQKNNLFGGAHGWSSILLLVSLVVLLMVIFGLVSYMFKSGVQDNRALQRERREARQGHSRRASLSDGVEIFDASADDPPLYEPPPDYEEVIKLILSGNNLKLVRRPGGLTAWVPDKQLAVEGGSAGPGAQGSDRPTRTRHASLDLEQGMEVVLWNPNAFNSLRRESRAESRDENEDQSTATVTSTSQAQLGHVRRSSLPVAPLPEVIANSVQGHSVSLAPETIPEAPEGLESPRPQFRHKHTLSSMSSPTLSMRSCHYDTMVSTPGPSTPLNARVSTKRRKSKKCSKKGGKRKRSSATRKPESQSRREDDSAPPSYEMAMQQARSETVTPVPGDDPSTSAAAAAQVNESTQTSIDGSQPSLDTLDQASPSERLMAVRQMFRMISDSERSDAETVKEPAHQAARRPAVPATRIKGSRARGSGGTISRGTVKARKAMLLNKAQKPLQECNCNGACSCAHFKAEAKHSKDFQIGTVKSKINYYLSIEESAKKRERDSSAERSDVELKSQDLQSPQSDGSGSSSNQKKRKLVRNQSAPTLGHLRQRNLDLYFSNNEVQEEEIISPTEEDMERPLLTPVSGSPKPVLLPAQDSKRPTDSTEEAVTPSIKTRVRLYNEMCDTPTGSSPSHRRSTPSPLRSPIVSPKENLIYRADSIESLGESKDSLICMRTMKIPVCDTPIKPGLVKEAKAKFITALSHDIRPKLCFQDSDDWNVGNESPVPIQIPYLNLQNEEVNSPDLSDGEKMMMPPLKQEEAESIELWDASSQGKSELVRDLDEDTVLPLENLPSPESGAVPKRSVIIAKASVKAVKQEATEALEFDIIDSSQRNKINGMDVRAKSKLKLNLKDKFSPASDTEKASTASDTERNLSRSSTPTQPQEYDLVVMHLGGPTSASSVASEDESPPPSPRRRTKVPVPSARHNLRPDLDETIDSEIDLEEPLSACGSSSSTKGKPQEANPKSKIPIPSPRGSKLTSTSAAKSEQAFNSLPASRKEVTTPDMEQATAGPSGVQAMSSPPSPVPASRSPTPSPTPRLPQSPQRPTLSPQMERSGIITIDTSKHSSWDYI